MTTAPERPTEPVAPASSTGPSTSRAGRSTAGWSEAGPGGATAVAARPLEPRYLDVELAGIGGMGTVMIAHDRLLGREVALKRIAAEPDDADAAARLAREAGITARLEHPAIVPIYDAGVGPDGRPYYAMRLVRGRSLAELIADAPDLTARLSLVRPFLAVCQAIAYAHRQGVLHRDLKPANVMIGEFGEVHVVDWGLARMLDETEPVHEALAGTPAYLAPERARGDGSSRASDVWSLGAILGELIAGSALMPASRVEILAKLSASEPPVWTWPERCSGELVAIANKALAWRVDERYADAEQLAADVSAYLDGRRVGAHAYTTTELARRLIYAWRWQVAAVTAGFLAAAVVLALTWSRIAGEQRRAVAAERRATSALADTRVALASSLERSAIAALLAGDVAEAETQAAQALTYGDSIDARGVLAAARAGARPLAATRVDAPGCARVVPDRDASFVCHDAEAIALWDVGAAAPRWRIPSAASRVLALDGRWVVALERGVAASIVDGRDGTVRTRIPVSAQVDELARDPAATRMAAWSQRDLMLLEPDRDRVRALGNPCGPGAIDAVAVGRAQVLTACSDGRVLRLTGDAAPTTVATSGLAGLNPASSATLDADERTLAIGGIHGELILIELATGTASTPRTVLPEAVRRVRLLGELVVVAGERPGAHVWSKGLEVELVRLPERAGGRFEVVGDALISGGTGAWWRWKLPPVPVARRYVAPAGLAAAAISPGGDLVVAARGDGRVSLWTTGLGRLIAEPVVAGGVVKSVAVAPAGDRVAVGVAAHPGTIFLDAATGAIVGSDLPEAGTLRVAYLADGSLVALPYDRSLTRWTAAGARRDRRTDLLWGDLAVTDDGAAVWLLSRSGEVWCAHGDQLERRFDAPGALALAPIGPDDRVAIATAGQITIRDRGGRTLQVLGGVVENIFDVAVSPDRRFVAAAVADGTIEVWSAVDGHRIAHLRGHHARVAWVGFAAGALWSAGWDGAVLRWDLTALTASAAALVADAATAWALPPLERAP